MRKHMAAVLAGLALVAGCGSESPGTPVPTGGNEQPGQPAQPAPTTAPKAPAAPAAPAGDVKIVSCEGGNVGVKAAVEVTNSMKQPWEYYGRVKFFDAAGAELTEGVFNTGTLQPGETSKEDVPGPNVYDRIPTVTCELDDVKLDEPE